MIISVYYCFYCTEYCEDYTGIIAQKIIIICHWEYAKVIGQESGISVIVVGQLLFRGECVNGASVETIEMPGGAYFDKPVAGKKRR